MPCCLAVGASQPFLRLGVVLGAPQRVAITLGRGERSGRPACIEERLRFVFCERAGTATCVRERRRCVSSVTLGG